MEYYIITSEDLEEKHITDEGLSKIVDFTGYEDVRAELIRRGVSEEKLTDEILNLVRMFYGKMRILLGQEKLLTFWIVMTVWLY